MFNKRSPQKGLFEADNAFIDHVGTDNFYGFLARQRGKLFRDEDFADLYCHNNGRPSVPPSILATALILQTYDNVSDEEAKNRADFDLRWKVALGVELKERPFAKSTLQLFRSQLIIHDRARQMFIRSIETAKANGFLKRRKKLHLALDTMTILGRGAVKDTYNLLADGITQLIRTLASIADVRPEQWAEKHTLGRYFESSIKTTEDVNWDDEESRKQFLAGIVDDADRLLDIARDIRARYDEDSEEAGDIAEAAGLLLQLLNQDIDRTPDGPEIVQGVAKDRICSVHDPEMRHGYKSSKGQFNGHKGAIATDTESQLITAVDELPGNAHDSEKTIDLVEQSEANVGMEAADTTGDCAFGTGEVRREFDEAGRTLEAPVPAEPKTGKMSKSHFKISRDQTRVTCPAGCTSKHFNYVTVTKANGNSYKIKRFVFSAEQCSQYPLHDQCVKGSRGRSITLHPQEQLMRSARKHQGSKAFKEAKRRWQTVEHRIA
jgi:transposase